MDLTDDERSLLNSLRSLHHKLRADTFDKYKRINPFNEDLFDWKERGRFWTGQDGITIYNSTSLNGKVEIGPNTWIGPFCSLDGGSAGLRIGSFCSISTGVQMLTHDTVRWCLSGGKEEYEYSPVSIGSNCFIGSHAIITKGVAVGDRCLIGAGAVVTKDVPSNTIVAGVPAKPIGRVVVERAGRIKLLYENTSFGSP